MNRLLAVFIFLFAFANCKTTGESSKPHIHNIPASLLGDFKDDYNITYTINDSLWIQHPDIKYHLVEYNSKGRFFIAKNDVNNPGEGGLYTRIDIMYFSNMQPWQWGFCLATYDAKTFEEAVSALTADKNHPKKGCGGFPFSRMKKEAK